MLDLATGEASFQAETATVADVGRAVSVARDAQPTWAHTSAIARGAVLRAAADVLEDRRDELAHRITSDMGKVLAESRAEVDEAAFYLRFMSGEGARMVGETRSSVDPRRLSIAERVPAGVVAAITPWNFPLCIPTWKIAPADGRDRLAGQSRTRARRALRPRDGGAPRRRRGRGAAPCERHRARAGRLGLPRDLGRALRFSRALRAGVVFVNAATVEAETHLPFDGMGGNGSRDTGLAALEAYTEWKTTYVASAGPTSNPPCNPNLHPHPRRDA